MKYAYIAALFVMLSGMPLAQSATEQLHFDLSKIGFVVNGEQSCEDKGRLQDYPSREMERIIAAGPKAVPVLIAMIADARPVKTDEPIICYWYGMTIGDCILFARGPFF